MKANFKIQIDCYCKKELKYIIVYNFKMLNEIVHAYINWECRSSRAIGRWKIKSC